MFGDIGKMLKIAGQMKAKLPEMKAKLSALEFTADAGGGVVSAVVNGKMQLIDIKIAPEVLADGDAELLGDLIKAAVSSAQEKAAAAAAEAMSELTGGMNLPGMEDLM